MVAQANSNDLSVVDHLPVTADVINLVAEPARTPPLLEEAVQELEALGENVEHRLGRRAANMSRQHRLKPRELVVLRFVSLGRTSREVAHELFLSPRTVEMHVSNILAKLEACSRTEATHRAHELKLPG